MEWFYLALLSGAFYSALSLFQRHLLKSDDSDPFAHSFFFSLTSAFVLLPFFITNPTIPETPTLWGLIILLSIFVTSQNFLSFTATKHASPSVNGVISKIRLIWVLALGLVFAYEAWSTLKGVGVVLTVIAGMILVARIRKTPQMKGVSYAFFATFFYAAAVTTYKPLLESLNSYSLTFLVFLLPVAINFFLMKNAVGRIRSVFKKYTWSLLVVGILSGGANLAIVSAISFGEASRVLVIVETFFIITVVGEAFILREREHLLRKGISAALATIGAILVRIAG